MPSTTAVESAHSFLHECLVIILIAYPVLLFLVRVYPQNLISPVFLLALTTMCTFVVSAILSVVILVFLRPESRDIEGYPDEKVVAPMIVISEYDEDEKLVIIMGVPRVGLGPVLAGLDTKLLIENAYIALPPRLLGFLAVSPAAFARSATGVELQGRDHETTGVNWASSSKPAAVSTSLSFWWSHDCPPNVLTSEELAEIEKLPEDIEEGYGKALHKRW
ncbi:hypothetical protein DFS33DRAFT_1456484 [Desarmillaria ectypa]|nr:hypothetical protein DFS33DRAFT_1456484 [Desarmillaria ectypa]